MATQTINTSPGPMDDLAEHDERSNSGSGSTPGSLAARVALLVATVLVGLSAGFFAGYWYSVIRGLAEVSDVVYVETFQSINATIRSLEFGIIFFGSLPALAIALAMNWSRVTRLARILLIAALPLYIACMAITFAGNVPLNQELAEFDGTGGEDVSQVRADFEGEWNTLHGVRTLLVVAGFAAVAGATAIPAEQRRR